jgi:hypothetical protein
VQRPVINTFLRKIAHAGFVVSVVRLICALVYGLVWLLNSLSSLITALATIAIALYTWRCATRPTDCGRQVNVSLNWKGRSSIRSSSPTLSMKAFGASSSLTIRPAMFPL